MTSLQDILAYICAIYRDDKALTVNRLEKLVFLIDWRAAIASGRQISPIRWRVDTYGPWTDEISDCVNVSGLFVRRQKTCYPGNARSIIVKPDDLVELQPKLRPDFGSIARGDREIIDHVIAVTRDMDWGDLVSLVYSTYPMSVQIDSVRLDLLTLAERFNAYERPARGLVAAV